MRTLAAVIAFSLLASSAGAQTIMLQQPVVGTFSVGTSVLVPDRGGAYLGSVARARESRRQFGFPPRGSSLGLERAHSAASTHVWIHDLQEMDRRLLQRARSSAGVAGGPPLGRYAEHAYRSLIAGDRRRQARVPGDVGATGRRKIARRQQRDQRPSVFDGVDPAARFLQLARRAEARGKHSLARLHYRMAARHGSQIARKKLASITLTGK